MDRLMYAADFETTVYSGQSRTDVWAAAIAELYGDTKLLFHRIGDFFNYLISLKQSVVLYFHNLKFDGSFILDWLLNNKKYKQAYTQKDPEDYKTIRWLDKKEMKSKTFKYTISSLGQWYSIVIKVSKKQYIEIRDSLKLLPFKLSQIAKNFNTSVKKLEMEYEGERFPGCKITPEEKQYIFNDVIILKEALEIMFSKKLNKLTIGSCCMAEFNKYVKFEYFDYDKLFPDLTTEPLNDRLYGASTVDEYIRRAYRGGWCYVVRGKENQIFANGTTADVNSLYPSMMHSESGNLYPYGKPVFWRGDYIPDEARKRNRFYYVRVKCRFNIKPGKLPFVQIKRGFIYRGNEMLETSDLLDDSGEYTSVIIKDGIPQRHTVTLTLTQTDWKLLQDHYCLDDVEILDGCYFDAMSGMFDLYINHWRKVKIENNNNKALRTIAKLMLNNLYGKLAASTNSSFKVAQLKPDGEIGFLTIPANDKKAGYIPVGAAITSYARNFTIRAAQLNYHGPDQPGFIYADTDSIHCDLRPSDLIGLRVHPTNFNSWSIESEWDTAIFVRQKTYIEHIIKNDGKEIQPYYDVKAAAMPEQSKEWFIDQLEKGNMKITDLKPDLELPGNLKPKRIPGGIVLVDAPFKIRA